MMKPYRSFLLWIGYVATNGFSSKVSFIWSLREHIP